MPNTNEKAVLFLAILLSQSVSDGFVLKDAMANAGMANSGAQVWESCVHQFGITAATSITAKV